MSKVLEHSAILSTFIKLPFANMTFVLSIFEWLLKTGFTVFDYVSCLNSKDTKCLWQTTELNFHLTKLWHIEVVPGYELANHLSALFILTLNYIDNDTLHVMSNLWSGNAVAQWKSTWLETERTRDRASPASLHCGP